MTLDELKASYDWAEVFADKSSGNTTKTVRVAPPGSGVDTSPMTRDEVAEIIASVDGERDELEWIGVFLLKDHRYLIAQGSCDYTGWDCQASNCLTVCATIDDVIQYGLTPDERRRLNL